MLTEKGCVNSEVKAKIEKMGAYGKQLAQREVWNGPQEITKKLGEAYNAFKRAKELSITPGNRENLSERAQAPMQVRLHNFKSCNEMSFIGQVIKIKTIRSEEKNVPASVGQAIIMSAYGDILCM